MTQRVPPRGSRRVVGTRLPPPTNGLFWRLLFAGPLSGAPPEAPQIWGGGYVCQHFARLPAFGLTNTLYFDIF